MNENLENEKTIFKEYNHEMMKQFYLKNDDNQISGNVHIFLEYLKENIFGKKWMKRCA